MCRDLLPSPRDTGHASEPAGPREGTAPGGDRPGSEPHAPALPAPRPSLPGGLPRESGARLTVRGPTVRAPALCVTGSSSGSSQSNRRRTAGWGGPGPEASSDTPPPPASVSHLQAEDRRFLDLKKKNSNGTAFKKINLQARSTREIPGALAEGKEAKADPSLLVRPPSAVPPSAPPPLGTRAARHADRAPLRTPAPGGLTGRWQ